MNVEIGTEAGAIPFLGIHKWDILGSVQKNKKKQFCILVESIYLLL
jgi:hypothetical protein